MRLSYVIVTRNRQQSLLKTLATLEVNTQLSRHAWEVIIVDNASDDDSAQAVSHQYRDATIIQLTENEGMPARNHGIKAAKGRYICLIDDDSYPIGSAIPQALSYLDRHTQTAAVVARVVNPNGGVEGPALPNVLLGGASVIRKSILDKLGGFSPEFFRQAEEYDLAFRILDAGYRIERFENIEFLHEKVPGGRSSALTHRMDLRNNLILVERFLPKSIRRQYRHDWMRRYTAFAQFDRCQEASDRALREARVWARRERLVGRRTLKPETVETIFRLGSQARAVGDWAKATGVRRVAIADFGKNFFATYHACLSAGLTVQAIVDGKPAMAGRSHRRLPIVPTTDESRLDVEGIVIANINPAQVDGVEQRVRSTFNGPLLRLWSPKFYEGPAPRINPQAA